MQTIRRSFRLTTLLCCAAMAGGALIAPTPAQAYDDDTHFVLTYYIARASGFTPEQAWRIAVADVGIDKSVKTEPLQIRPLSRLIHGPKVRADFHAFGNILYYNPLQNNVTAGVADALAFRYKESYGAMNPGVYLHAYQDSYAHYGYLCDVGHTVDGHKPDFLSWHPQSVNQTMVNGTIGTLTHFSTPLFPRRQVDTSRIASALDVITKANPAPSFYDLISHPDAQKAMNAMSNSGLMPKINVFGNEEFIPDIPSSETPQWAPPESYRFITNETTNLAGPHMPSSPSQNKDRYAIWGGAQVMLEQVPNLAGITYRQAQVTVSVYDPWFDASVVSKGYRTYDNLLLTPASDTYNYPLFPVGSAEVNFLARGVQASVAQDDIDAQTEFYHKVNWTNFLVKATKYHITAGKYTLSSLSASANIKKDYPKGHFNTLISFKDGNITTNLYFGGMNTYANQVNFSALDWDNFSAQNCHIEYGQGNFLSGTFEVKTDSKGQSSFRFTAQGKDPSHKHDVSFGCGWTPLPSNSIQSTADSIP